MKEYIPSQFGKDVESLVQIPSVSGNETAAQQHLFGKLQKFGAGTPGFSVWLQSVEGYQAPNLVAHIKGNNGEGAKKAVILTGHIDTVSPAGNPEEWQGKSPWSGEIVEGESGVHKVHGVGASDMKMGLIVLQHVFQELSKKPDLDCDLWFVSCINEELNGAGTEFFAKWWQQEGMNEKYPGGIAAIFGEPRNLGSSKTTLGIGNRANDFLVAEKTVGSHHSGELGTNIAFDIADFVKGLDHLNSTWKSQPVEESFTPPNVNPTSITTPNENINSTASSGSVKMDLRSTPSTQQSSLEQIMALGKSLGFEVSHIENPAPGAYTTPDSPLIKAFQEVLLEEGIEVSLATSPHSTDAGFLQAVGIQETVMAGAGTKEVEHTTNEYAVLEEGERAIGLTVQAILRWVEMTEGKVTTHIVEKPKVSHPELLKVFGTEQPMIGMVHLLPLPGYPGHPGMKALMEDAIEKVHALKKAGFDGILVENDGDTPPFPGADTERRDLVRNILSQIVREANMLEMPVGLEILYDELGTFQVANEVGAKFVRFDVFVDNVETARGAIIHGKAPQIMSFKNYVGSNMLIIADVHVKHAHVIDGKTLKESAVQAAAMGADVISVTGDWTGMSPNLDDLQAVKSVIPESISIAVGSGASVDNVKTLLANGANVMIVGTSIKTDGKIDTAKAAEFMHAAKGKE